MVETPTVNLGLRVPLDVHAKLQALSQERKESLNRTCAAILAHYVSKYPAKEGQ